MKKNARKTTKLTDLIPMQKELKETREALEKMYNHVICYLPEGWHKEDWVTQAQKVITKYPK